MVEQIVVREVGRYLCEDDDGEEYTVVEYQHFTVFSPINGPRRELPGVLEYSLANGGGVNWMSEDTFEIVGSGITIRKIS